MKILDKLLKTKQPSSPVKTNGLEPPDFVIRDANVMEIPFLTILWAKMTREAFDKFTKVDKTEMDKFAFALTDRMRMAGVMTKVAEKNGQIIGFLHAYLQEKPYGKPNLTIFCECLYVLPDFRGSTAKNLLVKSLIRWADEKNLPIEMLTNTDEHWEKIWGREGAKPYGIIFRREKWAE